MKDAARLTQLSAPNSLVTVLALAVHISSGMSVVHRHLVPAFNEISSLLGDSPELFLSFESWAQQQTQRLHRAAKDGTALLAFETEAVRSELEALASPTQIGSTKAETMRHAQEQWLSSLLNAVDELLA
jgi:hypothetical protein